MTISNRVSDLDKAGNRLSTLLNAAMPLLNARLHRADLNPDPLKQFDSWFSDTVAAGINEPRAMTLATVDPDNKPSARIVLLR